MGICVSIRHVVSREICILPLICQCVNCIASPVLAVRGLLTSLRENGTRLPPHHPSLPTFQTFSVYPIPTAFIHFTHLASYIPANAHFICLFV